MQGKEQTDPEQSTSSSLVLIEKRSHTTPDAKYRGLYRLSKYAARRLHKD